MDIIRILEASGITIACWCVFWIAVGFFGAWIKLVRYGDEEDDDSPEDDE